MEIKSKYNPGQLFLICLAGAIFIVYPNLSCLSWELSFLDDPTRRSHLIFFFFRYLFITLLMWLLIFYNLKKLKNTSFKKRLAHTFLFTIAGYLIYIGISVYLSTRMDCFTGTLLFQFFVIGVICTFTGHLFMMYTEQRRKEQEIEQLKIENLQSRCDALANQINPHFFFNSLNGLTSLIRKKNEEDTLAYVNKLSDVFRYILQSEKKGLVSLKEELEFIQAFRYMMEVRFANKLIFKIDVKEEFMNLRIPVLSLLPLIDNIVTHNTIDSEHKMEVLIEMNNELELVVSNPVYPKLEPSSTNGTGLKNLENRFTLLKNKQIRIEDDGKIFRVYLPLKQ